MILKGNIRAGGQELANHLMNERDNDRVELASIDGFASQDLSQAFGEAEAIATGTNCKKYLYSLSINPDKELTREQYGHAIDKIADKLGLTEQPRAVVFHVKNGREHCHVAWSRIDTERMQAVHMAFDKQRLREVARELVLDFGHDMPKHLAEDRGADRFKDKFNDVTLAEKGQAERSGITPEQRRADVTKAYEMADSAGAFVHALQERGYILAQGDRRGQVVVDTVGDVHSLTRQIEGATAKEIRSKMDFDSLGDLPTVQEAKELHAVKAREEVLEATQERADSPDRVQEAQDALIAINASRKAELKALKGIKADELKTVREEQTEQLAYAQEAIKKAYRPEWADLFKRQREEVETVQALIATPSKRLGALLTGRAGDAFDFENRGTMAGAFNFIIKGEIDLSKMERTHKAERRELGDMQKVAERTEAREIKAEMGDRRAEAQREHNDTAAFLKAAYADEIAKAMEQLEHARKLSERDGIDLSRGEVAERKSKSWGLSFGNEGRGQRGLSFDNGRDKDDEDDERPFKPPGQSFTP